jgi:hypothetical protein
MVSARRPRSIVTRTTPARAVDRRAVSMPKASPRRRSMSSRCSLIHTLGPERSSTARNASGGPEHRVMRTTMVRSQRARRASQPWRVRSETRSDIAAAPRAQEVGAIHHRCPVPVATPTPPPIVRGTCAWVSCAGRCWASHSLDARNAALRAVATLAAARRRMLDGNMGCAQTTSAVRCSRSRRGGEERAERAAGATFRRERRWR